MKQIKLYLSFLLFIVTFFSCVDTEEYIVVNEDHSGTYTIKMDMGKMMELMNQMGQMGGDKAQKGQPIPSADTLIYFKDLDAEKLTAAEKELYSRGYCKVKIDSATSQFKIEMGCPFKNIAQLPEIKKHLFDIAEKYGMDKVVSGKENKSKEKLPGTGEEDIAATLNPSSKDYDFKAVPGKISYKSNSLPGDKATNDSMMQMMQQLTMLTGDMTIKTVITLPHEAKKTVYRKGELSADKRTITFMNTLMELMEKPGDAEYEIEY
ncbi:MAG: hypothetical protein QM791_23230 [Ferruginibacter sp.]